MKLFILFLLCFTLALTRKDNAIMPQTIAKEGNLSDSQICHRNLIFPWCQRPPDLLCDQFSSIPNIPVNYNQPFLGITYRVTFMCKMSRALSLPFSDFNCTCPIRHRDPYKQQSYLHVFILWLSKSDLPLITNRSHLCREFITIFFFFWLSHTAGGILVPQPRIEPRLSDVKA